MHEPVCLCRGGLQSALAASWLDSKTAPARRHSQNGPFECHTSYYLTFGKLCDMLPYVIATHSNALPNRIRSDSPSDNPSATPLHNSFSFRTYRSVHSKQLKILQNLHLRKPAGAATNYC